MMGCVRIRFFVLSPPCDAWLPLFYPGAVAMAIVILHYLLLHTFQTIRKIEKEGLKDLADCVGSVLCFFFNKIHSPKKIHSIDSCSTTTTTTTTYSYIESYSFTHTGNII